MRLTLRTLLAYMDGILEPEQAEILRKKIEESDFAAKLMERIREVTRRLRLGAPQVEEKRALLDPNTVAEYLDNTLHGDRVPDFEKVCLESDMHLAEVASCHQILTMILGEPAEISPETRQRMYQLLSQLAAKEEETKDAEASSAEASAQGPRSGSEKAPSGEPASPAGKPKATVPEYLRDQPKTGRFWMIAVLLFLAGFTTVIILGSVGLLDPGKPLARLLGIGGPEEQVPLPEEESAKPTPSEEGGKTAPVTAGPGEKLSQPEGVVPKPTPESEKNPAEKAPLPEEIQKTPPTEPGKEKPSVPPEKPEEKTTPEAPPHEPKPETEKPEEKTMPPEKPAEAAPQLLGRLLSDREVLLRLDPSQKDWWRIAPQGNISSGERLLALPTFRPVIGLSVGVTITLTGASEVELLPAPADGPPGMKILFGRVLLSTVGKPNAQFRIQVEQLTGTLTFLDPDSTVALGVSRMHIPGNDPTLQPDPMRIEIYASSGRCAWTGLNGQPRIIPPMQFLPVEMNLVAGESPQAVSWKTIERDLIPIEKLPDWIGADTSSVLDRRASPEIELGIRQDRLARIGLMELGEHRLSEVRALAARCLSYLGEYQQMAAVLNKTEERAAWFDTLDLLQDAAIRGADSASAVRQALEKQYGAQNGAVLYRMLLGYTEAGLKSGEAATLVELLDHNDLVFRVMSFWNLQKLTGKGFYYQPEAPKIKRDPAVKRWRDWLAQFTAGKVSLGKESPSPKQPAAKPSEGVPVSPSPPVGPETPQESAPLPPSKEPNIPAPTPPPETSKQP